MADQNECPQCGADLSDARTEQSQGDVTTKDGNRAENMSIERVSCPSCDTSLYRTPGQPWAREGEPA